MKNTSASKEEQFANFMMNDIAPLVDYVGVPRDLVDALGSYGLEKLKINSEIDVDALIDNINYFLELYYEDLTKYNNSIEDFSARWVEKFQAIVINNNLYEGSTDQIAKSWYPGDEKSPKVGKLKNLLDKKRNVGAPDKISKFINDNNNRIIKDESDYAKYRYSPQTEKEKGLHEDLEKTFNYFYGPDFSPIMIDWLVKTTFVSKNKGADNYKLGSQLNKNILDIYAKREAGNLRLLRFPEEMKEGFLAATAPIMKQYENRGPFELDLENLARSMDSINSNLVTFLNHIEPIKEEYVGHCNNLISSIENTIGNQDLRSLLASKTLDSRMKSFKPKMIIEEWQRLLKGSNMDYSHANMEIAAKHNLVIGSDLPRENSFRAASNVPRNPEELPQNNRIHFSDEDLNNKKRELKEAGTNNFPNPENILPRKKLKSSLKRYP